MVPSQQTGRQVGDEMVGRKDGREGMDILIESAVGDFLHKR